jgi:hypothetical protein
MANSLTLFLFLQGCLQLYQVYCTQEGFLTPVQSPVYTPTTEPTPTTALSASFHPMPGKRCINNTTCSPGEFCYGPESARACLGKTCVATTGNDTDLCQHGEMCLHRILRAGVLGPFSPKTRARTGYCMNTQICGPGFFPPCPYGWTCIEAWGYERSAYCAPEDLAYDMGNLRFLNYQGNMTKYRY